MSGALDITVAVCTYNRATLLREALASLVALQTDARFRYEILVVDNGSQDETLRAVAEWMAASEVPIRLEEEPRPGVAWARNRALAAARGEWVAFFDDDQRADPCWLKELFEAAGRHHVAAVSGAVRLEAWGTTSRTLSQEWARLLCPAGNGRRAGPCSLRHAPGTGNLMLHRRLIADVGPFNTESREGAEDTDYFMRAHAAGYTVWYHPAAVVYHRVPEYRLTEKYLRWSFWRSGWNMARACWSQQGGLVASGRAGLRLAHAGLRLGLGFGQRSPDLRLADRCRWWKAESYARYVLHRWAPHWWSQAEFQAQLEFRHEREAFSAGSSTAVEAGRGPS